MKKFLKIKDKVFDLFKNHRWLGESGLKANTLYEYEIDSLYSVGDFIVKAPNGRRYIVRKDEAIIVGNDDLEPAMS